MFGNMKDKLAARKNACKKTPAATAPMANAYAIGHSARKNQKPSRNSSPQEERPKQARGISIHTEMAMINFIKPCKIRLVT